MMSPTSLPSKHSGFSLVEVVIALGIISFALIALLNLGNIVISQAQVSQTDVISVHILQEVSTRDRTRPKANLADTSYFFDAQGNPTLNEVDAFFSCTSEAVSTSVPGIPPDATSLSVRLLTLSWPVHAAKKNITRLPIYVAEYE